MKLSERIHDRLDQHAGPTRTMMVGAGTVEFWEQQAATLERSQRDAWRSFYVACAVAGVFAAFTLFHAFARPAPACPAPPAALTSELGGDPEVMQLDPFTIRAARSQAVWL